MKKCRIQNYILMYAVLFSMLLQHLHSYEHLAILLSEKNCQHKYLSSKEITHQHLNDNHCLVCNFTISSSISTAILSFNFEKITIFQKNSQFKPTELSNLFKGSLFALRAPPFFIV